VAAAGLMRPRPAYYSALIAGNAIAFAGLFALLAAFGAGWIACFVALGLGFVSGQLGFQLHDAGHRQMFRSRRLNVATGFVTANLLLGMSHGWWVDKHNRHHGNPNHSDLDPDIKVGVVSYSTEQALAKRGLARRVAAHQAYFFFPLLLGLAWAMHVASVRFLLARRSWASAAELGALALHFALYLGLLIALVGPWWAIVVVVIQKSAGGFYMASVFAPNHKGMPQVAAGERIDFLRGQVLTSRNVRSHPLTDFLYGGLNYQIEHHLFPTPRCHVRHAHGVIREYCREVGIPYHETSIVQSYREILGFLHEVGAPLRRVPRAA
jgi:fatty acid desaturase